MDPTSCDQIAGHPKVTDAEEEVRRLCCGVWFHLGREYKYLQMRCGLYRVVRIAFNNIRQIKITGEWEECKAKDKNKIEHIEEKLYQRTETHIYE